jgi:uncharacterized membrane protein YfcA
MGWARTRETSGVSVTFILVNSIAGILGNYSSIAYVPAKMVFWAPAALIGGWIGTELGTRLLSVSGIRRFLSIVLILAGLKLLVEAIQLLIGR